MESDGWFSPDPARPERCILYIVRRTQLYLDDQLWNALRARAKSQCTTVSELVRQAARERYLSNRDQRMSSMQEFVGSRKAPYRESKATEEVRRLRRGGRIEQLKAR